MDNNHLTVLTLLDLSNALNCVDQDILLSALRAFNMSQSVTDWFLNYLKRRRQSIRYDDGMSSWYDVQDEVSQGDVLSPLLFLIFINLNTQYISSLYHIYADDVQIYHCTMLQDIHSTIDSMKRDLANISESSRLYRIIITLANLGSYL
ncbi:unnamed protein product [Euphydryas editha]|uniref:Reverse transcriptase domain-containing protein n=1 Tax=Euphydryas editha TaxID=104508 RepID=A0AAU9TPW4_EUPED|nr:unnamed protein product [Euphydryas editha]